MHVSIVVAVSNNGMIGRDGGLPWKLSSDLKRFKALTQGSPIIMGRKTFESIGKPLPERYNIVISRDVNWQADGVMRAGSLQAALDMAEAWLDSAEPDPDAPDAPLPDEVFIIGGGQIYAQAMALADELCVTHVLADIDGDTSFPDIDEDDWEAVDEIEVPAGDKDSHATRYVVYERI